jgi:hypothetical protein
MKLSGSYTFSAPRDDVWQLLNDPETLQRIIPGCERLEEVGKDTYAADIKLGLAGVRGDYSGTVKISEQQPPEHYRLEGDGRGKPGFAKGDGDVELIEENGGTTMRYAADVQVGGPVAGIGQRLIEGAARSIINQSLKALSAELDSRRATEEPSEPPISGDEVLAEDVAADHAGWPTPEDGPSRDLTTTSASSGAAQLGSGLSTADVVRGIAGDLIGGMPWLPRAAWLLGALAVGLLAGIRIGRRQH